MNSVKESTILLQKKEILKKKMKNNSDRSASSRRAKKNEVPTNSQFSSRLMQEYAVDILSRQSERKLNTLIRNQNSILKGTSDKEHKVILLGKTKHVYNTSGSK